MKKLHAFQQDILRLLKSVEPRTLVYRDIKEQLAPKHKSKYKDDRVYGSALTYHLNLLLSKKLIEKDEETLEWGTLEAHFNQEKIVFPKKETFSIVVSMLSLITVTIIGYIVISQLKTEAHLALNKVWNSTPPLTRKIMPTMIDSYPYIVVLIGVLSMLALLYKVRRLPDTVNTTFYP